MNLVRIFTDLQQWGIFRELKATAAKCEKSTQETNKLKTAFRLPTHLVSIHPQTLSGLYATQNCFIHLLSNRLILAGLQMWLFPNFNNLRLFQFKHNIAANFLQMYVFKCIDKEKDESVFPPCFCRFTSPVRSSCVRSALLELDALRDALHQTQGTIARRGKLRLRRAATPFPRVLCTLLGLKMPKVRLKVHQLMFLYH